MVAGAADQPPGFETAELVGDGAGAGQADPLADLPDGRTGSRRSPQSSPRSSPGSLPAGRTGRRSGSHATRVPLLLAVSEQAQLDLGGGCAGRGGPERIPLALDGQVQEAAAQGDDGIPPPPPGAGQVAPVNHRRAEQGFTSLVRMACASLANPAGRSPRRRRHEDRRPAHRRARTRGPRHHRRRRGNCPRRNGGAGTAVGHLRRHSRTQRTRPAGGAGARVRRHPTPLTVPCSNARRERMRRRAGRIARLLRH